jgi:alpha-N-acetylglucosaminidase
MLVLVNDTHPSARIVISKDPPAVERHAAEELQKYIQQMTGAVLPIGPTSSPSEVNIFLNAPVADDMGFDGYVVRTQGNNLILAGAKPYSCLYAVYHLLERHLGCGFFEDGDQVSACKTIQIPETNDVRKPRFEWRIYAAQMMTAYSGMRWWDWEQFKEWVDWLAKKRYNMIEALWLAQMAGSIAMAATKMGIPIEMNDYQKQRTKLMRRVFDYARGLGMRISYEISHTQMYLVGAPGFEPYEDRKQLEEFVRRYNEKNSEKLPVVTFEWCGEKMNWLDPRYPLSQKFIKACVEATNESLGTDHLYLLPMVSEGGWASKDESQMDQVTYAMLMEMLKAVRQADPAAIPMTRPPFAYCKTFEAQKRAIRDAGAAVVADFWLNSEASMPQFIMCDYFFGLPWSTGMIGQCGPHTNPWGNLKMCISNARQLAANPRADKCIGFYVSSETNHRNIMIMDMYAELAWNPADVECDDYLRRWTIRRYGPAVAEGLQQTTKTLAGTLLSCQNLDITNRPMYRNAWNGPYLPGLTAGSVKRSMSYLPGLKFILETMLAAHEELKGNPLYRFDLVDYGRTYLASIFHDFFARARKALRKGDKAGVEKYALAVENLMHFMARYCSAHEQFRLKTHDDWAARWPESFPGATNQEDNWVTFTALISKTNLMLLDYMAEDYAELVEGYFFPRVKNYLDRMRRLVTEGKDISGKTNQPYRISDFAPPQGELPWSPYGPPTEPELKEGDHDLVKKIIFAESLSGKFDFYTGPMDVLVKELLEKFPVPEDLESVLAEPEPALQATRDHVLECQIGQTVMGLRTPKEVEQVKLPTELNYLVATEETWKSYNIMRGNISGYNVVVSHWLTLTREPDEKSEVDGHPLYVFTFESQGKKYKLRYDPGSGVYPAGVYIEAI